MPFLFYPLLALAGYGVGATVTNATSAPTVNIEQAKVDSTDTSKLIYLLAGAGLLYFVFKRK